MTCKVGAGWEQSGNDQGQGGRLLTQPLSLIVYFAQEYTVFAYWKGEVVAAITGRSPGWWSVIQEYG
jgi:hypothetical protein